MMFRSFATGTLLLCLVEASWRSEVFRNTSWQGSGLCGLASALLNNNDKGMHKFCDADLDFWWNWGKEPVGSFSADCAQETFIPMFWGFGNQDASDAQAAGAHMGVMGYNEPDHYAPGLSAGTFNPYMACGDTDLATHWQTIVNGYRAANPDGLIVSPAMADAGANGMGTASAGNYMPCLGRQQSSSDHLDDCDGWLLCFKNSVMKLDCGDTNCWDATDVLQFHAYFYDAKDFINKVKLWEKLWADDLQGLNGRTKKTLWVTEFARAGTTDAIDSDGKARAFMEESVTYLRESPYVSGWSWFSHKFPSFTIGGVVAKDAYWDARVITETGSTTVLGERYFELCPSAATAVMV